MRMSRPIIRSTTASALQCGFRGAAAATFGSDIGWVPQARIDAIAVEQIVRIERNDLAVRRHEMNAGALHRADAEIVLVEELHDHDAEHLVVAEIGRDLDLRQAAKQIAKRGLRRLSRGGQRHQIVDAPLQLGIFFEWYWGW